MALRGGGAEAIRHELQDGISQILLLEPTQFAAGVSAFNVFRKGTLHAATGQTAPLVELLDDLEPKGTVLRFLIGFHEAKRIYRKQIAAVVTVLLQCPSWRTALEEDAELLGTLPGELSALMERQNPPAADAAQTEQPPGRPAEQVVAADHAPSEAAAAPPERELEPPQLLAGGPEAAEPPTSLVEWVNGDEVAVWSVASATSFESESSSAFFPPSSISSDDVRAAIAAATTCKTKPAPPSSPEDSRSLLATAFRQIEEVLGGSVASPAVTMDLDDAVGAFECFRRAFAKAVHNSSSDGRAALDEFESKGAVLRFLLEFAERKRKHRSRVAAVLSGLMGIDSWEAEAKANDSLLAAVRSFTDDASTPMVKVGAAGSLNLQTFADGVSTAGGLGALCVHVVAARNLGAHCCPSVRVSLAGCVKRTAVSSNSCKPRWDAAPPFVFEVRSLDATVLLEVFDSTLRKDELLGNLSLPVASVPRQAGLVPSRHLLHPARQIELEVSFMLLIGCKSSGAQGPVLERAIKALRSWEQESDEPLSSHSGPDLRCPAGHPVTKKKEGLRWHQRAEFWKQSTCDLCDGQLEDSEPRWRCRFHCDFDVCQACYDTVSVQEQQSSSLSFGVDSVELPADGVEHRTQGTFFSVDIEPGSFGAPRRVMRRYNDFCALAEQLGSRAYCLPTAPFPEKLMFGCTGEKLEERRRGLELWLRRVIESPVSLRRWAIPVRKFLEVPDAAG